MIRAMAALERWKAQAKKLERETYALYLASRDARTPWYAKAVAILVVAYLFSPIDLIPDPIPLLGYLDDLVFVPLGIALALRLVPAEVMSDCRAAAVAATDRPTNRAAAAIVVALWLLVAVAAYQFVRRLAGR
jgi:uncharacterized membrane protein YkvA (DUF1232 family)